MGFSLKYFKTKKGQQEAVRIIVNIIDSRASLICQFEHVPWSAWSPNLLTFFYGVSFEEIVFSYRDDIIEKVKAYIQEEIWRILQEVIYFVI